MMLTDVILLCVMAAYVTTGLLVVRAWNRRSPEVFEFDPDWMAWAAVILWPLIVAGYVAWHAVTGANRFVLWATGVKREPHRSLGEGISSNE
jgi:hypothetical protein